MSLEQLKINENIIAASFWENFKYEKDMAQCLGGEHSKVKALNENLNVIRNEWIEIQEKIKTYNS
jgi:hypothetical protein